MKTPAKIVVVGASLAGQRAARALRGAGFAGELAIVGEELHAPYNRPPLSKGVLRGELRLDDLTLDRNPDELDATWLLGERAVGLDPANSRLLLEKSGALAFDALLIATGVSPRRLEAPGAQLGGVHYLRTYDDAQTLAAALRVASSLVVVGAGFIGCEVAACAVQMGLQVTVVDPATVPMERVLGRELGSTAQRLHEQHGVRFLLGRSVVRLEGADAVTGVVLDDRQSVAADVVVVGIGSLPNTSWLQGSGIACANGVICDETCLVPGTDGRIAAAGDVANWPHPHYGGLRMRVEHWSQAAEQGEAAAHALLGPAGARPFAPTLSMWSDQYGRKIQAVGAPWLGDRFQIEEGSLETFKFTATAHRGGRLVGAVMFSMPARVAAYRQRIASACESSTQPEGAHP